MRSLKDKCIFKNISAKDINANWNRLVSESNKTKLKKESLDKLDKILEKKERKLHQNHIRKITNTIIGRINRLLKNKKSTSKRRVEDILGCTIEEFKDYISSKFVTGMNWDNHTHNGWHLDHIIPISSAKNDEEILLLNHHLNFQPLWAEMNISKHDNYTEEDKQAMLTKIRLWKK